MEIEMQSVIDCKCPPPLKPQFITHMNRLATESFVKLILSHKGDTSRG